MGDPLVWIAQMAVLGFMGWGAYLCLARRDRRSGGDRRSVPRGGRRPGDYIASSKGDAPAAAGALPASASFEKKAA